MPSLEDQTPAETPTEEIAVPAADMIGTTEHHQRSEDVMNNLFGTPTEEKSKKEPEYEVEDFEEEESTEEDFEEEESTEEEEESVEEEEESVEEEDPESEGEVDWDDPNQGEEEENGDEDDTEVLDESAAQREARVRGREAKELRAENKEKELEIERLKDELGAMQAKAQELEAVNVRPEEHPDYQKLHSEIIRDVSDGADLLSIDRPAVVSENFGPLVSKYMSLSDLRGSERDQSLESLRGEIVDLISNSDVPYAEMDIDERDEVRGPAQEVLKILQRNSSKVRDLQELYSNIVDKAKSGRLATGVRDYTNAVKEIKPVLDSVGDLSDDMIEANPHSPDAVVAQLLKDSPNSKKLLDKAKADVLDVILGPRALTQEDIDKLEAKGEDIKDFVTQRNKAHRTKRKKFAAMFVQALMTRKQFSDALKQNAELRNEADADDAEQAALRGARKKKTLKPAAKPTPKKTPLQMLGFDDEEN